MKFLKNKISVISVENVLDDYPKNTYDGSLQEETITMTVSTVGQAIYVGNSNIINADLVVKIAGDIVQTITNIDFYWSTYQQYLEQEPIERSKQWIDYDPIFEEHTLELTVRTLEPTVSIGIIRAGSIQEFRNINHGSSENYKDYSIVYELTNGSRYLKKRDVTKINDVTFHCDKEDVVFFHNLLLAYASHPIPVLLVNDRADYLNFGWVDVNAISKNEVSPTLVDISFSIEEAI